MKKEEKECYTVEREFLNKISIEELISRIIKSHLADSTPDSQTKSE